MHDAGAVMEHAEVVVVGGGPAGALTAMLLARAGHDVQLLDKHEFPRDKPCGDCISPGANLLLRQIGLLETVHSLRPARLSGWRLFGPRGTCAAIPFEAASGGGPLAGSSLALPRSRLDHALLLAASAAGVRVRLGTRVRDISFDLGGAPILTARTRASPGREPVRGGTATDRDSLRISARLVVGADGLRSTIARRTGAILRKPLLRKISLTAHIEGVGGLDAFGEMHFGDGACVGLAPTDADLRSCNVTVVVSHSRRRQVAADPGRVFRQTIAAMPELRARFEANPEAAHELLACGPFDWPTRWITRDGVALVGDAAGYYDPLTGQGIYQSIAGALRLAATASAALRAPRARRPYGPLGPVTAVQLGSYARSQGRLMRRARQVQKLMEEVTRRPKLTEWALRRLQRGPLAAAALIAVTGDLAPPHVLLSPRALLSFAVPRPVTR